MAKINNYIYVVFSTTPYKLGGFIRFITGCKFNHVSVAFDKDLYEMYSFARYHKNTPLYGGFVRESFSRFINGEKCANIKVCKIKADSKQLERCKKFIKNCEENNYKYNLFSAILYPFSKDLKIKNSYTCIEFCLEILRIVEYSLGLKKDEFCSTKKLSQILADKTVFSGQINNYISSNYFNEDTFLNKLSLKKRISKTLKQNGQLILQLFTK